ncbi:MAG: ABC transporter ATP-binding protein [Candidatus Moranbacteria bacterium]|nr:ABC transporter ATP-binding protein [Candidatus Moranbacteria bacterium]
MSREKRKKKEGFWSELLDLLAPSVKTMKRIFILMIFVEAVKLVGPYLLKVIIDVLTDFSNDRVFLLLVLAGGYFLSLQAVSILDYLQYKKVFRMLINIEYYLPVRAEKKLMDLPLSYHEKEGTGNKIIKIEKGATRIIDLMANASWEVVPTLLQLVATLAVLLAVNPWFGAVFAFFSPIFIWITYDVNRKLYPIRKRRWKRNEESYGKMAQSIININTVKSFAQEIREAREFKSIKKKIRDAEFREWFYLLKIGLARNLVIDFGRLSILFLGAYFVWSGIETIGTLVFVFTLSEKSYLSLYRLSRFYDKLEEGKEAVGRFIKLTKAKSNIINPQNGIKPERLQGKIEFKNVSFSYKKEDEKALRNINLKIIPESKVALVGPSGGGKTTLARMIYRHYDPKSGEILLDGRNLKDYDIYSMRKKMAIVPQEVEIFDSSIRDNISYANPKAGFKEIQAVARVANADEFIQKLSNGYDTLVGERGTRLSGGQRQRIGIARALLANPDIIIFDEATSNLDSQSERLIQEAMERISKGRTIIIIAHRLSTVKKADKIVVIEEGKIIEEGNHCELSESRGGVYARLLKLQKMGDIE